MKRLFFIFLTFSIFTPLLYGQSDPSTRKITLEVKEGTLILEELLVACEDLAKCIPSRFVQKDIAGKIIQMQGKSYEIRFFSFEDTQNVLAPETTFKDCAIQKNLLPMKSISMDPMPTIHIEGFDYRKANLGDGVYFHMFLREFQEKPA